MGLEIEDATLQVTRAYEARAWYNFYGADWSQALRSRKNGRTTSPIPGCDCKIQQASKLMAKFATMELDPRASLVRIATQGLLSFRTGESDS